VRVRFTDLDGKVPREDAEGLFATCIQHEIDHLNGVLFVIICRSEARPRAEKFAKPPSVRRSSSSADRMLSFVMPGLVPGIHVFLSHRGKGRGWRDKPGMTSKLHSRRYPIMPLRLIFMGTPVSAWPTLLELVAMAMRLRRSIRRRKPAGAA